MIYTTDPTIEVQTERMMYTTDPTIGVQTERIDDIPLLLYLLIQMEVQESIDAAYTPHGNHEGLSIGWLAVIWLTYIVSAADHRMVTVQEWVIQRREALEQLIGQPIRETDFTDDRLANVLRYLSYDDVWHLVEAAISRRTIRVYNLEPTTVRLDATVGQVYHDADAHPLFNVGRTKDGDYDVQFKLMLGALDPMGLPVAVDVVSGEQADDPLYVPVYQRIRQTLGRSGLLYISDSKGGALETRATMQLGGDFYLVPLAMVGDTPALLEEQLARLWAGEVELTPVYLPEDLPEDPEQAPDPDLALAQGFEVTVERTAEVDGQTVTWQERGLVVQSTAYAEAQRQALARRLRQAEAELLALTPPPGRGKRQFREEAELQAAVEQIVAHYRVTGLLDITWERQATSRHVRGYGGRPARVETTVRYQVHVTRNEAAIEAAERRLGWRLYATNSPAEQLPLSQAVLAYRDQYLVEGNFARLNGRRIGLLPLYVQRDDHALGLIRLLTIALRLLVTLEFVVRRALAEQQRTLSGVYAGNPKRCTARPTAELLLEAFADITLTTIRQPDGRVSRHLTPLTGVQETILGLLGLSPAIYIDLLWPEEAARMGAVA